MERLPYSTADTNKFYFLPAAQAITKAKPKEPLPPQRFIKFLTLKP